MNHNTDVNALLDSLRNMFPDCDPVRASGALLIGALAADARLPTEVATAAVDSVSEVLRIVAWFASGCEIADLSNDDDTPTGE